MYVIVKKYEHVNSALPNWDTPRGKYISTKKKYYDELKRTGMIPYEEAKRILDNKEKEKKWIPSADCHKLVDHILHSGNKKKEIILSQHPKVVDEMKKRGMSFEIPDYVKGKTQGGFNAID